MLIFWCASATNPFHVRSFAIRIQPCELHSLCGKRGWRRGEGGRVKTHQKWEIIGSMPRRDTRRRLCGCEGALHNHGGTPQETLQETIAPRRLHHHTRACVRGLIHKEITRRNLISVPVDTTSGSEQLKGESVTTKVEWVGWWAQYKTLHP